MKRPKGLNSKYAKVISRLPPESSVLEIGCHTGYFSRILMNQGHKVLGIEKDEEAARIARSKGIPVISGDVENSAILSPIERKFNVVLLMDVLEHLRDPAGVLRRLKPAINEQGQIIVTGPNVAYWAVRKDLLLGRWNYQEAGILDRTHLHFYTASTWCSLIEKSGYQIRAFEPAEAMIPLENILSRLPVIGKRVVHLRRMALHVAPKLFTICYLIEAVPSNTAL